MMGEEEFKIHGLGVQRSMCSSSFGKGVIGSNLSRNQFDKSISRLWGVCVVGVGVWVGLLEKWFRV